jgi:hypothetical protein
MKAQITLNTKRGPGAGSGNPMDWWKDQIIHPIEANATSGKIPMLNAETMETMTSHAGGKGKVSV